MNYFQQLFSSTALRIRVNMRSLFIFGLLAYFLLFIIGIANPTLSELIFKQVSSSKSAFTVIICVICAAYTINISFGTFRAMKYAIGKRREYLLLPFDVLPKLHSLYAAMFIWFVLNSLFAVAAIFLISITMGLFEPKNFTDAIFKFNKMILESPRETLIGAISAVLMFFSYVSGIVVVFFIKTERKRVANFFILTGITVGFSYIFDFIWRIVNQINTSFNIKFLIVNFIISVILIFIAHMAAYFVSVKE